MRGDELPEVRLMVNRRLSPQVITSLESSVAMGGGGTFVGADRQPYENQVHYMVTSLDTQFQSTATGVFFAVHHLSQELQPLRLGQSSPQMQTDRVRLMLTQDLNILFDLASQWAVQLNMELSRGPLEQRRVPPPVPRRDRGQVLGHSTAPEGAMNGAPTTFVQRYSECSRCRGAIHRALPGEPPPQALESKNPDFIRFSGRNARKPRRNQGFRPIQKCVLVA